VISVGGGAVMDDTSWDVLKTLGTTLWIRVSSVQLARRLAARLDSTEALAGPQPGLTPRAFDQRWTGCDQRLASV
jgi:shikimate kinase